MKEIYLLLATKEYISVTVVSSMNNECPNNIVNIGNLIHPMILNQMILFNLRSYLILLENVIYTRIQDFLVILFVY